jgi:hypothetical protein
MPCSAAFSSLIGDAARISVPWQIAPNNFSFNLRLVSATASMQRDASARG